MDQAFRIYNNNLYLKRVKLLNVTMLLEFVVIRIIRICYRYLAVGNSFAL